ncbi:MAG: ATP-binding protein [Bacteroidia bacterium]|nr:ATP-binding protein [Bacteroidia bacterium]
MTFKPGLNIIIGKNGTGKTNLLEGIKETLNVKPAFLEREADFGSKLVFIQGKDSPNAIVFGILNRGVLDAENLNIQNSLERIRVHANSTDFPGFAPFGNFLFKHSIPKSIPFLTNFEAGWSFRKGVVSKLYQDENDLNSITQLSQIVNQKWRSEKHEDIDGKSISNILVQSFDELKDELIPWIRAYTAITNMKVQEGWIDPGILNETYEAKGFRFLFEINGAYYPFQNLSDGTKRIVLLIMEVCKSSHINFTLKGSTIVSYVTSVEEPELGIHPHQLQKLMAFLKEQSKNKQIILTTHSPQVLDILNKDELDRIIIADFDPEKGSTFRHLDDKEIANAQNFMSDMYLSDYWRFSDLEVDKVK